MNPKEVKKHSEVALLLELLDKKELNLSELRQYMIDKLDANGFNYLTKSFE